MVKKKNTKGVRKKKSAKKNAGELVRGVCISCTKPGKGYAVIDDYVIESIRWIKKKAGIEKRNKLIICSDCSEKHKKKRKSFERSLILYGGIGVVIAIILLAVNFSLSSFFAGLLFILFLVVLAHLKYAPRVKGL